MSAHVELELSGSVGRFAYELSLSLDQPGPIVLAGPNGAGKSTALKAILGALRPTRGRLAVGGRVLFDAAAGIDVPMELRGIGYVPQRYALFPHLSVLQNVAFGAPGPEGSQAAQAMLQAFELGPLADRRPDTLSGGELQRAALARALAPAPALLLLDEPVAAQDVTSRRQVRAFLSTHLRSLRIPSIVVTHDMDDAAALGERLIILEGGRVADSGPLTEVLNRGETAFVRELAAHRRS